jgi:glutaredoxin
MLHVFTNKNCQPCRLAKKQLENNLIDFEEWDVNESEGKAKAKEMNVNGGLPYFVYGERRYAGWIGSINALTEYLEMS